MLLLGMADGGISILRLNPVPLLLSAAGPTSSRPARLPHHSDLASANECRPGFAKWVFVVPPYLSSRTFSRSPG